MAVAGVITSIEFGDDADAGGQGWLVGLKVSSASGEAAERAMGQITVRLVNICGPAPYGNTFMVGSPYIMLLNDSGDGKFYPVNTTQGVVPIVDGHATVLERNVGGITISRTAAAGFGAPFAGTLLRPGDFFELGDTAPGMPDGVVPQFGYAGPGAAWSPEPSVLWVFTNGSTGCPLYASAVATPDGRESADGKQWIRIVLSNQRDPNTLCLSDLVHYTTSVTVPDGVDETKPVMIAFVPDETAGNVEPDNIVLLPREEAGQTGPASWAQPWPAFHQLNADTLLPMPGGWVAGSLASLITGPDALPDAAVPESPTASTVGVAWTAEQGLLYVFTWDSSSCPVIAESHANIAHPPQGITPESVVTLRSVNPDANAICTADLVPTTSVVAVSTDLDDAAEITVRVTNGIESAQLMVPPRATPGLGEPGVPVWGTLLPAPD